MLPGKREERMTEHTTVYDVAIRGGTVVLDDGLVAADLFVDGERIGALTAPGMDGEARTVLDASGCLVMPGAVDAHAHVHIPYVRPDGSTPYSHDDFLSASRAAAAG